MDIPLLDAIAIQGKTLTVDALLTQRKFAEYVVNREADYHSTVKNSDWLELQRRPLPHQDRTRLIFDYLKMTKISCAVACSWYELENKFTVVNTC